MTVTFIEPVHPSLMRDLTGVHLAGSQIEMLDAQGNRLSGPDPATLPVVTEPPRILPEGAMLGQSVTLYLGSAAGSPAPVAEWDFTLDGASMRDRLDSNALTMELALPGVYVLSVGWRNGAGVIQAAESVLTVAEPVIPTIDYDMQTLAYLDADTVFAGTASDVTSVTMRGTGGYVLTKTGTGKSVGRAADGFVFGDGVYLQTQSLTAQPSTDGLFAVVDVTLSSYGSNIGQILDGTGGHIKLRNNAGAIQAVGVDDSSVNLALGNAAYGSRMVLAGQIDDLSDLLSGYDTAGNPVSIAHTGLSDPAPNRIALGRYLNGTIHRLAIVGRAEGQSWPVSIREVVEDFRRGA